MITNYWLVGLLRTTTIVLNYGRQKTTLAYQLRGYGFFSSLLNSRNFIVLTDSLSLRSKIAYLPTVCVISNKSRLTAHYIVGSTLL